MSNARQHRYWSSTKRLTAGLLAVWLVLNLVGPWFARDLSAVRFFGFPFGFWVAAQGALVIYLLIIVVYVWRMEALEADYLGASDANPDRVDTGSGPA